MDSERWKTIRFHVYRWRGMMDRCYDPDCPAYPNYGGRGIKVCEAWHNFHVYADQLPHGHFPKAELDRIDNDGDYEPSNVRWATRRQNCENRRNTRLIDFNGRTQSLSAWSRDTGINLGTLHTRIVENGWAVDRALTEPVMGPHERMTIARKMQMNQRKVENGQSLDEPYITKKDRIPKRVYKTVVYQGERIRMVDLAKRTGIPLKRLSKRITERGWDVDRAVSAG